MDEFLLSSLHVSFGLTVAVASLFANINGKMEKSVNSVKNIIFILVLLLTLAMCYVQIVLHVWHVFAHGNDKDVNVYFAFQSITHTIVLTSILCISGDICYQMLKRSVSPIR